MQHKSGKAKADNCNEQQEQRAVATVDSRIVIINNQAMGVHISVMGLRTYITILNLSPNKKSSYFKFYKERSTR